jgi:hypothetical protein
MAVQGERFGAPLPQAESASILSGLTVHLPRACTCGSAYMRTGAAKGPHLASLRCTNCGRHCGWISTRVANLLLEIIGRFGRPTKPIEVRP